jgi:hypothetical protein
MSHGFFILGYLCCTLLIAIGGKVSPGFELEDNFG